VGRVKGKTAIVVDDIIDTAASVIRGSQAILNAGAEEVYICATHPVFAGPATIPINKEKSLSGIKVLSVAEIFAEAISRIHNNLSISTLFR